MTSMRVLPASTSYAVGFGVSSLRTPPTHLRFRPVVVAKGNLFTCAFKRLNRIDFETLAMSIFLYFIIICGIY